MVEENNSKEHGKDENHRDTWDSTSWELSIVISIVIWEIHLRNLNRNRLLFAVPEAYWALNGAIFSAQGLCLRHRVVRHESGRCTAKAQGNVGLLGQIQKVSWGVPAYIFQLNLAIWMEIWMEFEWNLKAWCWAYVGYMLPRSDLQIWPTTATTRSIQAEAPGAIRDAVYSEAGQEVRKRWNKSCRAMSHKLWRRWCRNRVNLQ